MFLSLLKMSSLTQDSWGTICKDGAKNYAPSFDTIGFFARSISDIQLISREFRIIGGATASSSKEIKGCRFGFVKSDQYDQHASEDVKRIFTHAQSLLSSAGATVEELNLGPEFDKLVGEGGRLVDLTVAEARVNFLAEYRKDKSRIDPMLNKWVESDRPVSGRRLAEIQDEVAALRGKFDTIAGVFDAIITPSVPGEAPEGLGNTGDPRFCTPWTGLHCPAINIPGFTGSRGLPIGLTLVAPR